MSPCSFELQMELDYKKIGLRIRTLRKHQGFTQEELAEAADLSSSFLSHIERGYKKVSLGALVRIAAALNTTVDFLLSDTQKAEPIFLSLETQALLSDCSAQERQIIYETTATLRRLLRMYPPSRDLRKFCVIDEK